MEDTLTPATHPGNRVRQYCAAVIVNIISFAYGTIMGWPANAIPILQSPSTPLAYPLSDDEASWLGSLLCLGAFMSTPFYSYLSQRMGRKLTGYIVAVPLILSWVLMIFAQDIISLYISRIIVGISSGGLLILCPLYVGEIAEDSVRGALGTFMPFFINAGILFAFIVGAYVDFITMSMIYMAIPVLFLIGFPFIPETPTSLLNRDKTEEALKSLMWLRGTTHVEAEMSRMKASTKEMKGTSSHVTLADLLNRGTIKAITIGVVLCANQQLSGIFAIMTYTVAIFQESGSDMSPNMCTMLVASLQLSASVVATLLMDRAGRKLLLIVSNVSMAFCLTAIGIFFYFKSIGMDLQSYGWVPVLSLSAYVIAFSLGMGPVPFIMISEIFTSKVRGIATTLSLSTIWLLAFAVAKLYSNLTDLLGTHGCYWLFAACCILGAIFAAYVVPETKNRTLESILQELNGVNISSDLPWKSVALPDPTMPISRV